MMVFMLSLTDCAGVFPFRISACALPSAIPGLQSGKRVSYKSQESSRLYVAVNGCGAYSGQSIDHKMPLWHNGTAPRAGAQQKQGIDGDEQRI